MACEKLGMVEVLWSSDRRREALARGKADEGLRGNRAGLGRERGGLPFMSDVKGGRDEAKARRE